MNPKVSILMPVYDGMKNDYLRQSVESILNQTFKDFEFIIVDDASTDRSYETLLEYAQCDNRILLSRNKENSGISKTLNDAIKLASADLLARMDVDDIASEDRFEKQYHFMRMNKNVALSGSFAIFIDESGNKLFHAVHPMEHTNIVKHLQFVTPIFHPSWIFRKEAISSIRGYRDLQPIEDYELLKRFVAHGYTLANIPEYLLRIRIDSDGISMKSKFTQNQMKRYIRKAYETSKNVPEETHLSEVLRKLKLIELSRLEQKGYLMHEKAHELKNKNKLVKSFYYYFCSFLISKYERRLLVDQLRFHTHRITSKMRFKWPSD